MRDDASDVVDLLEGLTLKERRFVEAYLGEAAGNGTRAAKLAGYRGGPAVLAQIAYARLRKREIQGVISQLTEHDELVAGRVERLRFLTRVMRGEERDQRITATGEVIELRTQTNARLRAAEKLAELAGDFREPEQAGDGLPPDLTLEQLFDLADIPRGTSDSEPH
jgi:phage terminase small subunit